MNDYNNARVLGIMLGLVIALIAIWWINKNKKVRTEYDEMQKQVRGTAYMYAFYTVVVIEGILALLESYGTLPMEPFVIHFLTIMAGISVQAAYCILNDAYVGLNTQMDRFIIFAIIAAVINLLVAVIAWMDGRMVVDGILQAPFVNFMCFVVFAVLGVIGLFKKAAEDREDA